MAKVKLSIQNISKSYRNAENDIAVINNISLDIYEKEFVCILGYSGCGKSTLLKIVSQLEQQDSGKIFVNGNEHTAPNKDCLLLFQDFNQLFPWKTVEKNIMYPIIAANGRKKNEMAKERAKVLLESVGLSEFKNYYPHQLSGGMKQRGAVARALASEPEVLLMDEPFSALDANTRWQLQNLTKQVCSEFGTTVLFVTHSIDESVRLSDRIVILSNEKKGIEKIIDNVAERRSTPELRSELVAEIAYTLGSYHS